VIYRIETYLKQLTNLKKTARKVFVQNGCYSFTNHGFWVTRNSTAIVYFLFSLRTGIELKIYGNLKFLLSSACEQEALSPQ
jgi:hypothetical protein